MKIQNNNISDFEQKNVKVHRNVASKKMKVGVMWSALFVLAVIGVLSVIGAVLAIKPKTEAENKNLVTYASMPLEIQDGVITKYNGTTDGTAVLNIPATYDVVDGELVEGSTYKITGIGEGVFKDVNFALLTVNLDNITRIGDSAFENATRVAFVGGNGYTIGKNAFKNAKVALEEVKVLPNGEEPAVDVDAFSGTTFLKSLKSPNSLSAAEVSSATAFTTTAVRGIIKFASNSLTSASSVNLSGFSGKVIFADNCAKDSTSLGAVTLNSKLSVEIGSYAFANTQNGNFAISGNANFRQIGSFAFLRSKIQSLNLSTSSLKTISQGMFSQCGSLASITLPSSVTSIGNGAFVECSGLTSITIPDGVTSIGNGAFGSCIGLTSITIPSRVTTIGASVFQNCSGLTSITIPDSVTSIGSQAFRDCSSLTSITIEGTAIPTLGSNAFISTNNCDINVRGAVLVAAETVTNWSTYKDRLVCPYLVVQYNDGGSTKVGEIELTSQGDIPDLTQSITTIDGITISSLKTNTLKVYIPKTVTAIGDEWFDSFTALTSVTIPSGLTYLGDYAFAGCTNLSSSIVIPSGVGYVREGVFERCSSLTSVVIPNSVTSIDAYAFLGCSSLTSITIPSSVTGLGSAAFENCTGLTSITIERTTAPSLGDDCVFDNTNNCDINVRGAILIEAETDSDWAEYKDRLACPYLVVQYKSGSNTLVGEIEVGTTIDSATLTSTMVGGGTISSPETNVLKAYIPKCVTTIGQEVFYGCRELTSITIGSGVTTIGQDAFRGCDGLTSITIPSGVTTIGQDAFHGCEGLTSITIPSSVTTIGDSAFYGCEGLTSITIPSGVTTISREAFYGCSGLTSITIPSSVTIIDVNAFSYCSGLTSITIGSGVTSIGAYAFSYCSGLTSITIPDSVTTIGDSAFLNCSGLTSITMGSGVTSIGGSAFYGCSGLTSITIPDSVTSIGSAAFFNCSGLTSITIEATTPPTLGSNAFYNTNNCPIYVPSAKVSTYKAASGWSSYASRIQAMGGVMCTVTLLNPDGTTMEVLSVAQGTEVRGLYSNTLTIIGVDEYYCYGALEWCIVDSSGRVVTQSDNLTQNGSSWIINGDVTFAMQTGGHGD